MFFREPWDFNICMHLFSPGPPLLSEQTIDLRLLDAAHQLIISAMPTPSPEDRIRMRERPTGRPVMKQSWQELLFLHWDFPVEQIQATLPPGLYVDTYDGKAWLGVVPFWMRNIRPWWFPPVPGVSNFLELNLRTYVHDDRGTCGVWFYSLDANQSLAVWTARRFFHLNYQHARMESTRDAATGWTDFSSYRAGAATDLVSQFRYRPASVPHLAAPGSFDFFLVERYVLFAQSSSGQFRTGTVIHDQYQISEVELPQWSDSLFPLNGFARPARPPVHAAMCRGVEVDIYPLRLH